MFYADIHGGSIVYLKRMWEKYAKYPDISLAEDASFLKMLTGKAIITKLANNNIFIYVRHDKNSWEFICGNFIDSKAWRNIPPPPFINKDLNFYRDVIRTRLG